MIAPHDIQYAKQSVLVTLGPTINIWAECDLFFKYFLSFFFFFTFSFMDKRTTRSRYLMMMWIRQMKRCLSLQARRKIAYYDDDLKYLTIP
jgi:hypothetical protein